MAVMIPSTGPRETGSQTAEPLVFEALSKLDDNFTVIHSLPWITSAVRSMDPSYAPTGEIDFIVLHPHLGILVIEVKGGIFKYDRHRFVYVKTKKEFDPIGQLRRGTFALARLIQKAGIPTTIGYGWIFPQVALQGKAVPPGLMDPVDDQRLYIDYRDTPNIGQRVIEIMEYWRKALRTKSLTPAQITQIVDEICPQEGYTPSWEDRIDVTNRTWLQLNDQQRWNLDRILEDDRTVITGRAGTGKTILGLALARILAERGKKVLVLFFNRPIATKIKRELEDTPGIDVTTFHALCLRAEMYMGIPKDVNKDPAWFSDVAHQSLQTAILRKKMPTYDAVIVDEGQIFHAEWYAILRKWIPRIHVFCDETQAFPFETRLTNDQVQEAIEAERVGLLTVNMRSPVTIFRRLEISLPANYQQTSPRPNESDTLQEIGSFFPDIDLVDIVRRLRQENISPRSICILTSASKLRYLKESGLYEKLMPDVNTIESSSKARGLEFPIVIVYGFSFEDQSEIINAYARATSRVVAIYNIQAAPKDPAFAPKTGSVPPFITEVLKNPEFKEAITAPFDFLVKQLGWQLELVPSAPFELYWNQAVCAWTSPRINPINLSDKLWIAHLLSQTPFPFVQYFNIGDYPTFDVTIQSGSGISKESVQRIAHLERCDRCHEMAISGSDDHPQLCAYCRKSRAQTMPSLSPTIEECERILAHPWSRGFNELTGLGIHLTALLRFNQLNSNQQNVFFSYLIDRFPGRNGYQALLILLGIDLLEAPEGQTFTITGLVQKYRSFILPQDLDDLKTLIPFVTSYWLQKGWLLKMNKGEYQRTRITTDL